MAVIKKSFNEYNLGEQYLNQLNEEANKNFRIFLLLLSSYFLSKIDGPSYARAMKSMSIEVARVKLALDQIRTDTYYRSTRGEFLYQVLTSIVFPRKIPNTGWT